MTEVTPLLLDYVSDELSPAAKAEVEARLVADPVFRAKAEPLLAAWRAVPRYGEDRAAADALRRAITVTDRRPVGRMAVAAAAAIVCAVLGVYGPGVYRIVAPVVAAHAVVRYTTGTGERRTVRLPDGSSATLGPETRLRYRATFFRPVPEVAVHGAVEFDAVRPLDVRVGATRVEARQGKFDVENYDDVRVTALDSSVQVVGWTVVAGTTAHVIDNVVVLRRTSDEGRVTWDGNALGLVRVPFAEAVRAMRRWYGVDGWAALQARGVWDGDRVTFSGRP
jgi:ferric-dicitrate binding protein FerR (iron transport regulator)